MSENETYVARLRQFGILDRAVMLYLELAKLLTFSQEGNVMHLYLNMESNSQYCALP